MATIFLEIFIIADDYEKAGFEGRDEIEDPLDEALQSAQLGDVSGGGGGIHGINIDVEVNSEKFETALSVLRQTLQQLGVPRTTEIRQYEPTEVTYSVYD